MLAPEIINRYLRGEEVSLPPTQIAFTLAELQSAIPHAQRLAEMQRLHLLVQMSSPALIDQTTVSLREFTQKYPSRAFMLVLAPHSEEEELTAAVSTLLAQENSATTSSEQILLLASGARVGEVAALVLPLLQVELPVCYWFVDGIPADTPLLEQLRTRDPFLLFDSAQAEDLGLTLARANALAEENLRLSDLNWIRLAPWRTAVTEVLAQVASRRLEKVTLTFGGALDENNLGQSALLLSWLAQSLGWELMETLDYAQGSFRAVWTNAGSEIIAEIKSQSEGSPELHALELVMTNAGETSTAQLVLQAGASTPHIAVHLEAAPQTQRTYELQTLPLAELLQQEFERKTFPAGYREVLALATKLV